VKHGNAGALKAQAYRAYKRPIDELMNRVRAAAVKHGMTVSPLKRTTRGECAWMFLANDRRVTFTVLEQAVRAHDGDGVGFIVSITGRDQEVLATFMPADHKGSLWSHDLYSLETRFDQILISQDEIVAVLSRRRQDKDALGGTPKA